MSGKRVITKILEVEHVNANRLAEIIDVKATQIYDLISGKTKKISEKFAEKILYKYSKYSKTWLLTGEGKMFNDADESEKDKADQGLNMSESHFTYNKKTDQDSVTMPREVFDILNKLTDTVQSQQRTIELLERQNK